MRILFGTSEMTPLAKTGGLADVSGALPRALAGLGHEVTVALPFYGSIDRDRHAMERVLPEVVVDLPAGRRSMAIWRIALPSPRPENPVTVLLVEDAGLFQRPGLYGTPAGDYPDNALRFGYFCMATFWALKGLPWRPDVIVANDWQSALMPIHKRLNPAIAADPEFAAIPCLFAIHNIAYQGSFDDYLLEFLGLPRSAYNLTGLEFYGRLNLLKGAIQYADHLVTVSPTYAREIQRPEFGFGLDGAIRARAGDLTGILNGIDNDEWDPATDPALPGHFSAMSMKGKAVCKHHLQQHYGLPPEPKVPVAGLVTRLVEQKGLDLLEQTLEPLLRSQALQVVVLGSGEPRFEHWLRTLARRFPRKVGVRIGFDERLARLIEGGSDIFLMPSRFEPCGLNQLYSLRYGTVPLVRRTGGLADSIADATPDALARREATGFVFDNHDAGEFSAALARALALYRHSPAEWDELRRNGMRQDFSWAHSAREYEKLFGRLVSP